MADTSVESRTFMAPNGSSYLLYFRPDHDPFHVAVSKYGCRTPSARLCFDICEPNDTFFDVGANIGTVCVPVGTKGTNVYAFELLTENFLLLERAVTANRFKNFHPFLAAVSDATGLMYARGQSAWGTTHDSGEPANAVASITVDEFVAEHKTERVDLLKIDVEGHEKRVLQGAEKTLHRFCPSIVIEANVLTCGANGYSYKSLMAILAKFGYSFYRIHSGFIEPVDSEYWQEVIFCDYLCISEASLGERLSWPVRKRERSEVVASIAQQQILPQVHQDYVVIAAENAPDDILQDVVVREKLTQWKQHTMGKGTERALRVGVGLPTDSTDGRG